MDRQNYIQDYAKPRSKPTIYGFAIVFQNPGCPSLSECGFATACANINMHIRELGYS